MLEDAQGLAVTTDSPLAITAINRLIDQSLSYGNQTEAAILQGLAADRTCVLVHAYAAAYWLSQESLSGRKQSIPHLKAAERYASEATHREQLYVQAIAAWAQGKIHHAIRLQEAITQAFPRDLMAVQQGQYHYFYLGDSDRLLRIGQKALSANPDNAYLLGMVAFGLQQCDRLAKAEAMGRQATALSRHNPWAHHAVAHVMETQARITEGIAWMEDLAPTWESCNSMLYTHNWWHVALYYLALGNTTRVLELYDTQIWGRANQGAAKDQVGAIATLLRLELRGIDVGDRWHTLSPFLQSCLHDHALPFQDLHYVYALARVGQLDWLREMLTSQQAHTATVHSAQRHSWTEIAIPAARGLVAHAQGDWSGTIAELQAVLPRLQTIGGSQTQRALFEQIYRDALHKHDRQPMIYAIATLSAV